MHFLLVLPSLRFWETGRHTGQHELPDSGTPLATLPYRGTGGNQPRAGDPLIKDSSSPDPRFSHPLHRHHLPSRPSLRVLCTLVLSPAQGSAVAQETPAGGTRPPAGALTAGQGSAELGLSQYLRPPPPRAELRLGKNQKQLGCFPAPEAGVGVLRRGWEPWCLFSPLPFHPSSTPLVLPQSRGVGGGVRGVGSWEEVERIPCSLFMPPRPPPHTQWGSHFSTCEVEVLWGQNDPS